MRTDSRSYTDGAVKRSLPDVWVIGWRLLAVLAALEFGYLLLANVILLTPAVRAFATKDHSAQFLIGMNRGSLDLNLHELVSKRLMGDKPSPTGSGSVEGVSEYRLRVPPGPQPAPMELRFRAPRLAVTGNSSRKTLRVEHIDAGVHVTPDLTGTLDAAGADAKGTWSGSGHALAPNLVMTTADETSLAGHVKLDGNVAASSKDDTVKLEHVNLDLAGGTLGIDERASRPWTAVLKSDDIQRKTKEKSPARATVELHADDADALTPLVVESPIARQIESTLLGLNGLDAKTAFRLGDVSRFELVHARAGIAQARGMVTVTKGGPVGAFLVSTGVANVGVRVRSGETSVVLFVGDHWLDKQPAVHRNATP